MTDPSDAAELVVRLERVQNLVETLSKVQGDFAEQHALAERIQREIASVRAALKPLDSFRQ